MLFTSPSLIVFSASTLGARCIRRGEVENVDLIYKIEGRNDLDVFELARVLDSFGNVLKENYRITHPEQGGEMKVRVKPFEEESFIMDVVLHVQQNPGYLFFASHPEIIKQAKEVLEYLGFIKKAGEYGTSFLELLKKLGNEKPKKVEKKGPDRYEFTAEDDSVVVTNSKVNAIYNNQVVHNNTINIYSPVENGTVDHIATFLKSEPVASRVTVDRSEVKAVRAYSNPVIAAPKVEVLDEVTTKILNPKSGNYGQTNGSWVFKVAGTKNSLKAKIVDLEFLKQYADGSIRFLSRRHLEG